MDEGRRGQSRSRAWLGHFFEETGLRALYQSNLDVKLLNIQRFVRQLAYGQSALVLVSFMEELGVSRSRAGLFMTLTLVGDIAISFILTLFADAMGRRAVLAVGAALMIVSGIVFALFDNYWILLAAAVFGVISPRSVLCSVPSLDAGCHVPIIDVE